MWAKRTNSGFTIVELLIVIVVIAVLATITIVAYNGIQARARISSVSSALAQTKKKIALWQVDNPGIAPSDLATAGISNTSDVTYQYTAGSNGTYCITATNGTTSYKISESTSPVAGGCPGHGQGGVAAITNLATNPSVESTATGWAVAHWQGATGTAARDTSAGATGTGSYKMTWSTSSTAVNAGIMSTYAPTSPGSTYVISAYVKSPAATTVQANVRQYPNADGTGTFLDVAGSTTSVPANTWTRISATTTVTAGYNSIGLRLGLTAYMPVAGDTFAADGLMVTQGTTLYSYADGNSANWVWNGTTNNSTSTGPPL